MNVAFYIAGVVAVTATLLAVTRRNAVHALLYFIVSLLAAGVVFFVLGAPFVAALVVIINAGAIMVLFLFVIMMLNIGPQAPGEKDHWAVKVWLGPGILCVILLVELVYCVGLYGASGTGGGVIEPKEVGIALFGPYLLAVELASMLLLAGAVGAYHLGRDVFAGGKGDD